MPAGAQRVLVIEGDRDGADALQLLLESWGYEVAVAYEAAMGVAIAAVNLPDAVVLDLALPSFDARCALVERIRGLPGGDAILIVAVTGHGGDPHRRRANAAGCDFFFVKPADLDKLRDALTATTARREWAERARRG
jgi:CheY-like chemotaxis protein